MGTLDYYTALVRLAPAAVAKSAVRRVQGAARQALYRRRYPVDELRILQAYGAASATELASRFLETRHTGAWCEPQQRSSVLQALAAIPGAKERALERAQTALRQEFNVFGTCVAFGEGKPVDWSLDVWSGYRFPLEPVEQLKLQRHGSDPKYAWELGRLDSLVALAQGYWVEQDEAARSRFARAFVLQVIDFLQANPTGMGVHWTCPMEVALRAANVAQALAMFAEAPEVQRPEFLVPVLSALTEHTAWVEAHLEDRGAVPNNHLVSNFVGLLVVGLLFPELPNAPSQVALAVNGLRAQMEAQVHAEGTSFEGSTPYHRLSVELFTLAYVVGLGAGTSLGDSYTERLRRMYGAARAWCSEQGLAPQVGDNDSGRVFPLRDRADLDHGYLAPLGAALFSDGSLAGGEFPDEAAWLLGLPGLERFQALPPAPPPVSVCFPEGGFHVLRGAGAVVTVSAGPQGQGGVGGHNHNDKLSFELHLGGVPVIVDPGTGTYTRDPNVRNAFRGTALHNTLQLDGVEQVPIVPERLFALPEAARARVEVFQAGPELDRLSVRHDGYRSLPAPVGVERTFYLDKRERVLSVTDRLVGTGTHDVVGRLHLPDTHVRMRAPSQEELRRALRVPEAPRTFEPLGMELGPAGAARALVLFAVGLSPRLEPSRYSPGYGRVEPAMAVVYGVQLVPPAWLRWVVVFL
ncbi:alginate lyase family protein [Hyalangium rubrum]|uniref:Alginate lyase family protein n=1 Tax=Hyalangium rubrum TaxID=3103134 RepID=A0ABU5GXA7_9BACT|nr:alginate lyase family protein [Hyalangium sp. s54d21]MDY7225177.1 alginate lyase family protein [Hyalangium sp. s54d21]